MKCIGSCSQIEFAKDFVKTYMAFKIITYINKNTFSKLRNIPNRIVQTHISNQCFQGNSINFNAQHNSYLNITEFSELQGFSATPLQNKESVKT